MGSRAASEDVDAKLQDCYTRRGNSPNMKTAMQKDMLEVRLL
jgi:hypothetical protein